MKDLKISFDDIKKELQSGSIRRTLSFLLFHVSTALGIYLLVFNFKIDLAGIAGIMIVPLFLILWAHFIHKNSKPK